LPLPQKIKRENQPEHINANAARVAKDASRQKIKPSRNTGKQENRREKLCEVFLRLSYALVLPDFLLVPGSVTTFAAFALKRLQGFPRCGKIFSTLWKNNGHEAVFFPRNGKTFSDFSTQWNNFEVAFPHCGKRRVPSPSLPGDGRTQAL